MAKINLRKTADKTASAPRTKATENGKRKRRQKAEYGLESRHNSIKTVQREKVEK